MRAVHMLGVLVLSVVAVAVLVLIYRANQDCRARGGVLVQVIDRPPWACVPVQP